MATSHSTSISDAPHAAAEAVDDAINASASTAHTVVKRAVQGAHAAVDSVAKKVESAVDRFKNSASGATGSLQDGADQFVQMEKEVLGSVRSTVRDHPLLTIGLALAAGVLISRMITSR